MLLGKDINKLLTLKGNIISSSACEINRKIFSLIQENISPLINIDDIYSLVRLKGKEYQYILLCNDKMYILSRNKMAFTIYYDSINRITRDNNIYNNKSINGFYYSIFESYTRTRETIGLKITYTINHKKQNFYMVGKVKLINYIRNYVTGQLNSKCRHYNTSINVYSSNFFEVINKINIDKKLIDIVYTLIKQSNVIIWKKSELELIFTTYYHNTPKIIPNKILKAYFDNLLDFDIKFEYLAYLFLHISAILNNDCLFENMIIYIRNIVLGKNKNKLDYFINEFLTGRVIIKSSDFRLLYLAFISNNIHRKNIIITANMSSGKSTLINAIIGNKIAQSALEACTNNIIQYHNRVWDDLPLYDYRINQDSIVNNLKCNSPVNNKTVRNIYFRSVYNKTYINLIDTPGVNNSLDLNHKDMTLRFIMNESYDLLVYVLDCGKLGTNEELSYLSWIANNVDKNKVIFVLNKVDILTKEDNLSESIRKLQFDLNALGFQSAKVYPIMAYPALLFKLEKFNEYLNDDEIDELELYKRRICRDYYGLNRYIDKIDDINMLYINNTGILELEKIIFS